VHDDIAAGERPGQRVNVLDIDARAARDHDDIRWVEPSGQMTAHKSGSAGDCNAHCSVLALFALGGMISLAHFSNMFNNYFERVRKLGWSHDEER
jgi:hypothetical protein